MDYHNELNKINEGQFLISMTPVNGILEIGFSSEMNNSSITAMVSDTHNEWERYIMWSARRHLKAI